MPFHECLYIKQQTFQWRHTSSPTGLFEDPLDFVNRSEPWLEPDTTSSTVSSEKKTLLFADHFFKYRTVSDKASVVSKLKEVKSEGFKLLILRPNGVIKEWDGQPIPDDYCLDSKTYTQETINHLAWTQHQLSTERFYTIDYLGMNNLFDVTNGLIYWSDFENHPADLIALLRKSVPYNFFLRVNANPEKFINCLLTAASAIPVDKIEGFVFEVAVDEILVNRLFEKITYPLQSVGFTQLNTLSIFKKYANQFKNLSSLTLQNSNLSNLSDFQDLIKVGNTLIEIDLTNSYLSAETLNYLLQKSTSLQYIRLIGCKNISGAFKNLPQGHLKNLYTIWLNDPDVTDDDIIALLQAAPALKILDIKNCKINKALQNVAIKNLEAISFGDFTGKNCSVIDFENLTNLLQSSLLKELEIGGIKQFSDIVRKTSISLNKLKSLTIFGNELTEADWEKMLNAATNLYELKTPACRVHKLIKFLEKHSAILMTHFPLPQKNHIILDHAFFDTTFKNQTLSYREYFPGEHPSNYRLFAWKPNLDSKYDEHSQPDTTINDFKSIEHDLQNYSKNLNYRCHKAIKSVETAEGKDIILPSLDAEEKLFNLNVFDANGKLIDLDQIKLKYSASTQFYQISLPRFGRYTIQFQVAIPKDRPKLPNFIEKLRLRYMKINCSNEPLKGKFSTLKDFANLILEQKIGDCKHRCITAYAELFSAYKNDVRIIGNDVHMRLELKIDGYWHAIDLGGYPFDPQCIKQPPFREWVDHKKQKEPTEKKSAELKNLTPLSLPQTSFATEEISLAQLLKSSHPSLVIAPTATSLENFYKHLRSIYTSNNIFIAHRPSDLNLTGFGMTHEGAIKDSYTLLQCWLQKMKNSSGVIVIDAQEFKSNELAQLNDILDGMIADKNIPSQIRILLIDKPGKEYGPDFRRRVTQKTNLAFVAEDLLQESKEKLVPLEDKDTLVIDLFDSAYWQNKLVGMWRLISTEQKSSHAFKWKKGKLLKALTTVKQIVFKNPPLDDKQFIRFMTELKSLRQLHWADQTTAVPDEIQFYQTQGYDWQSLSTIASINTYTHDEKNPPYFLSNTNLLSFIQDPAYQFSSDTNQLIPLASHLTRCQKQQTQLNVMCAPGLTKGALAEFLTKAKKKGVSINFLTPDCTKLPTQSPLRELKLAKDGEIKTHSTGTTPRSDFHLTDDIDFSIRKLLIENPKASAFDLSYLENSELGRYPFVSKKIQEELLATGKLSLQAPFSSIIQKLQQGEHVILYGKIPSKLWDALLPLIFGYIEREPFLGKLTFVVPSTEADLIKEVTGHELRTTSITLAEKNTLLKKFYPACQESKENLPFVNLERNQLQTLLTNQQDSLTVDDLKRVDDEQLSIRFVKHRLYATEYALSINPWMMIEGPSGIGKSHFLTNILGKNASGDEKLSPIETVYSLEEWLTKTPTPGKKLALVVDEANFSSQLSNDGDNFLARFKTLKNNPPGFLWKGKYYELTPDHRAIFAFNPACYGAGRITNSFLEEQSLSVTFEKLPPFYIRHHIITPFLKKFIPEKYQENFSIIAKTFIDVYEWILSNSTKESLITPREIKAMLNFIGSQIKAKNFSPTEIKKLAKEITYIVGRQTLVDAPYLLDDFDKNFKPAQSIFNHEVCAQPFEPYQEEAYRCVTQLLEVRNFIKHMHSSASIPDCKTDEISADLGLGGIVLEGLPAVGKTRFFLEITKRYASVTGEPTYRISANTPYSEKIKVLRTAFSEGALVIADEFNTNLWPNKMLNNFLMGLDEEGHPAKVAGFLLFATQNPPCIAGRTEDDPALRRRLIKITTDKWPVHPKATKNLEASVAPLVSSGAALFAAKKPADLATMYLPTLEKTRLPDLCRNPMQFVV